MDIILDYNTGYDHGRTSITNLMHIAMEIIALIDGWRQGDIGHEVNQHCRFLQKVGMMDRERI